MWMAIKTRHLGVDRVKEARLQTLMTEFNSLKMIETNTIDEFTSKLTGISSKAAFVSKTFEETKTVKKFLTSLPEGLSHHSLNRTNLQS
ncbi:hypothetical protein HanRHA438_Chr14g0630181 [Helianthus annuus]|nr:hypothetical protein HanRHA438_Chr14g0630181 [Helianthus annuus]